MNLVFNLEDLVLGNFKSNFRTLDAIIIHPACQLRKIFTMKNSPQDTTLEDFTVGEEIPRGYVFPVGVDNITKIIDMNSVVTQKEESPDFGEKESKIYYRVTFTF